MTGERVILRVKWDAPAGARELRRAVGGFLRYVQYRDKQGDPKKALDLYRRAVDRGVRSPKLKEWIDVKERILSVAK